jgi:hypothetical protein
VYIHVLVEKRTNLEPSGEKGLFIGYSETSKEYRIWISIQRKIVVSQDVRFEENLASSKSHDLLIVAEDEEQMAPKGEHSSHTSSARSHSSGGDEKLAPSSSVRRPKWFEKTL